MIFRNKQNAGAGEGDGKSNPLPAESKNAAPESLLATEKISVRDLKGGPKPVGRNFPGPKNADAALRVAVERRAHAELVAHAKESLEVEVCGVLVGEVCEDSEGVFVHVEAVIRGTAGAESSTHVTFTQATWNAIHKSLERDYPKLRIVGWYHTHPGFGVEFSDMDLFIQKNFFSGPTQIALVTDPLSGAVAICMNTAAGARYLPRYWMDAREQPCRFPQRAVPGENSGSSGAGDEGVAMRQLEARVAQLGQLIDQQQASYYRFLLFCGVIFCLAVAGVAGYVIHSAYISRLEPPRLNSMVPVPVQVGDKTMLVGVGVVEWKVPDELNAMMIQALKLEREAAEKEAAKNKTNPPASGASTSKPR